MSNGNLFKARQAYDDGEFNSVIIFCNEVIKEDKTNAAAWELKGDAWLMRGNPTKAMPSYKTATIYAKDSETAWRGLSTTYEILAERARGKYQESYYRKKAEDANAKTLQIENDFYSKARKAFRSKDYNLALEHCKKALKQKENKKKSSVWSLKGSILLGLKDYKGALKAFKNAVKFDPESFLSWKWLGRTHQLLAIQEKKEKKIRSNAKEAVTCYSKSLALNEDDKVDKWKTNVEEFLSKIPIKPGFWGRQKIDTEQQELIKLVKLEDEEEEDLAKCSECNEIVPVDATKCPSCGLEFEEEEEELVSLPKPPSLELLEDVETKCSKCGAKMSIHDYGCEKCGYVEPAPLSDFFKEGPTEPAIWYECPECDMTIPEDSKKCSWCKKKVTPVRKVIEPIRPPPEEKKEEKTDIEKKKHILKCPNCEDIFPVDSEEGVIECPNCGFRSDVEGREEEQPKWKDEDATAYKCPECGFGLRPGETFCTICEKEVKPKKLTTVFKRDKIKCPKCDKIQIVKSKKRPITVKCVGCGQPLILKKTLAQVREEKKLKKKHPIVELLKKEPPGMSEKLPEVTCPKCGKTFYKLPGENKCLFCKAELEENNKVVQRKLKEPKKEKEMTACPACGTEIVVGIPVCPNCNSEFEW